MIYLFVFCFRLPALTHKMATETSCSIPRRHSISTNMVVTSISAGNEKSVISKSSSTRVEGTASEGNNTYTSRHGHGLYRKPQNNHEVWKLQRRSDCVFFFVYGKELAHERVKDSGEIVWPSMGLKSLYVVLYKGGIRMRPAFSENIVCVCVCVCL